MAQHEMAEIKMGTDKSAGVDEVECNGGVKVNKEVAVHSIRSNSNIITSPTFRYGNGSREISSRRETPDACCS